MPTTPTTPWTAPTTFHLDGLRIGTATCALQVEGGAPPNSWGDFAAQPGRIADASTPEVATDHWNRWREDLQIQRDLGLQVVRLGVEWARIEPEPARFDEAVLERYREELAALKDAGLRPMVTLHHFADPRWLTRMGGWEADEAPFLFLRYTRRVVEALGDLVDDWCTINEPNVYAVGGYLFGEFPPGRKNAWASMRLVLRNMAVAHCRAYHLIHELQPRHETKVGFAHHLRVFDPQNPKNPVHRAFARSNEHLFQGALTDAFLGGEFGKALGGQPDEVRPGRHYDYLGVNYYSRSTVSGAFAETQPTSGPVNDLGWEIYPEGLVRVARRLHAAYPGPIWVTENGTADNTDSFRARFLHDHLAAMVGSGLPFERYYHWCLVDNWEWAEGFVPRFGLVEQDGPGGDRTLKPSARFLQEVIAAGGVTTDLHERYVAGQEYPRAEDRQGQP